MTVVRMLDTALHICLVNDRKAMQFCGSLVHMVSVASRQPFARDVRMRSRAVDWPQVRGTDNPSGSLI